jgi:hypothetical protein
METTQGIFLYSYLYLKQAKTPYFSYSLLCFFFYKIRKGERDRFFPEAGVKGLSGMGEEEMWQGKG